MNTSSVKTSRHSTAFTLIELAVILVVLGVLVSLLVATALRNSAQIKRAECASNLQQFSLAMQIYGNENNDKLPSSSVGLWTFDIPWTLGGFVESTGSKWTVMFCPGTSPSFTEADNFQLYNSASNSYRVIGYAHTLSGNSSLIQTNANATLLPEPIQVSPGTFVTPLPSERILSADATISDFGQINQSLQFSPVYRWTGIFGGFYKPHLSPHLSGRFPMGGNVVMLDGHVAWRKFKDMRIRTVAASSPGFWW